MQSIIIYQTKNEIGYANKKLRAKIWSSKQCLRCLFTQATNEEIDWIDEVNMISETKCANMLRNILNDNSFTTYMS
jgi:hypothetical protein